MELKYKYITRNLFDVFWGDGWDNCARVKRNKGNEYVVVRAYKRPPKDFIQQVTEESYEAVQLYGV